MKLERSVGIMKAIDYAKFFISQKIGAEKNSLEGNMKLQKLLFFADMINLAQYDSPLFDDDVYAFEKGCVIESVRQKFQYDYDNLLFESMYTQPCFNDSDKDTLNITLDIFGALSSKELSELSHQFEFWKNQYDKAYVSDYYKEKEASIITIDMMREEINIIQNILSAYKETRKICQNVIKINGVSFYYEDDIVDTSDLRRALNEFSINAEDDAYSIYFEDGELVIY